MRRHMVTTLALALLATATLAAQPGPRARGEGPGLGAEGLLRMRERLALTEEQVNRLRALRDERLNEQRTRMGQLMELRSRFRSGDLSAEEFRAAREEAVKGVRERRQATAEQLRGLLTDEQRNRLHEARRELRQAVRREMVRREMVRRDLRRELRRDRIRDDRGEWRQQRDRMRERLREPGGNR